MKRLIIAVGAIAALGALLTRCDKPLPFSLVEGGYWSPRCGELRIQGATLASSGMSVRYELRRMKSGLFIVPDRLVYIDRTAADGRCRVLADGFRNPLMLPLGAGTPARSIDVRDDQGNLERFDRTR